MSKFTDLITSEHQDKPKFFGVVEALTNPFLDILALYASIPGLYDVDTAIGHQLDVVGEWVGVGRYINVPITGVWFTWNDVVATGWNKGVWLGANNSSSAATYLPDDSYRKLIKAKIVANQWDGSIGQAYTAWSIVFPGMTLKVTDTGVMTATVELIGSGISALDKALFLGGYLPIRPAGVLYTWVVTEI